MPLGICRTPGCSVAAHGEPIERYAGPGEFCPDCGERLASAERADGSARLPVSAEQFEHLRAELMETLVPERRKAPERRQLAAAALLLALGALAGLGAMRVRVAGSHPAPLAVCASSIAAPLAAGLVQAYADANPAGEGPTVGTAPCEVSFVVAPRIAPAALVAHDAVVVVVNPANAIATIGASELRAILTGDRPAWRAPGAPPGPIAAFVPADGTDEARALAAFLGTATFGGAVRRVASSADVVRAVASAGGRAALGIAAFSVAAPAKVVPLDGTPVPSALTIADHRYPLALDVGVEPARGADAVARRFAGYARSEAAQSAVVRDGLIARKGY